MKWKRKRRRRKKKQIIFVPLNWNPLFVNASNKMWTLNQNDCCVYTKLHNFFFLSATIFHSLFFSYSSNGIRQMKKQVKKEKISIIFWLFDIVWETTICVVFFFCLTFMEFKLQSKTHFKVQSNIICQHDWLQLDEPVAV